MRKVNYKGRCTKRKLSKCKEVCRTYDEIQMKVVDMLQATDDIKAFRCNVCLEGVDNNQYMSDLVAEKSDGSDVRSCIAICNAISFPDICSYMFLYDISKAMVFTAQKSGVNEAPKVFELFNDNCKHRYSPFPPYSLRRLILKRR